MSVLNVNKIADASGGVLAPISSVHRNRIINGSMTVDQRNAGASVTPANQQYTVDRWQAWTSASSKFSVQQNAGSVTPPAGFRNYMGVTSLSAYSVGSGDYFAMRQQIEGFNVADLNWGTANAQTVTLSFWVRSSLTGTFGGTILNNAVNRSYAFTYTISSANTWEQKSVTIAGDTTGTWETTNSTGMYVNFGLGVGSTYSGTAGSWGSSFIIAPTGATSVVGTNGATWYVTGVQLEKGTQATSFEYRQYGTELALCKRYCNVIKPAINGCGLFSGVWFTTTVTLNTYQYSVEMRSAPTLTYSALSDFHIVSSAGVDTPVTFALSGTSNQATRIDINSGTGRTAGQADIIQTNGTAGVLTFSAEL